jgi:hypothetical protein
LVEQLESIKENPSFRLAWEKRNCGKFWHTQRTSDRATTPTEVERKFAMTNPSFGQALTTLPQPVAFPWKEWSNTSRIKMGLADWWFRYAPSPGYHSPPQEEWGVPPISSISSNRWHFQWF